MHKPEQLFTQGLFSYAVIEAVVACEVVLRRRMAKVMPGESNAIERYVASIAGSGCEPVHHISTLIGVDLETLPCWEDFQNSVRIRNEIVHRAQNATRPAAKNAIQSARKLIAVLSTTPMPAQRSKLAAQFGQRVRERMQELSISQRELAKRSRTSQSCIRTLLAGEHSPTTTTIERIAAELGISVSLSMAVLAESPSG